MLYSRPSCQDPGGVCLIRTRYGVHCGIKRMKTSSTYSPPASCLLGLVQNSSSVGFAEPRSTTARYLFCGLVARDHEENAQKNRRKGIKTLISSIQLGLYGSTEWSSCLSSMVQTTNPSLTMLLRSFNEEHHVWCLARVPGLFTLGVGHVDELG
jgi:hypothetical protein